MNALANMDQKQGGNQELDLSNLEEEQPNDQ